MVEGLQALFVYELEKLAGQLGERASFERVSWLRDGGLHGGGHRYQQVQTSLFSQAAINVSSVHYDDLPNKRLRFADALSTIIHPSHPLAPSIHMHLSYTELRDAPGSYRIMADLNPAIADARETDKFRKALRDVAPTQYARAEEQGDRYFYIPSRKRHRGATHFYLEGYNTGKFEDDSHFAHTIVETAMRTYVQILGTTLIEIDPPTEQEQRQQLAYHSLYLMQVLTLDRGTTSGLLVHDQNDLGIMGSLPAFVDRELLASWASDLPAPQGALLRSIVATLSPQSPSRVDSDVRLALAQIVRNHYRKHPEALALQATGAKTPATIANHS